jgi:uncharacterized protein (DUF1800 family)
VTERVAFQSEQEGDGVLTSEEARSSGNLQIIGALAGAAVLSGCGGGTETTSAPAPVPVSISDAQASRLLAQATIGYSKSDLSVVRSMGIGPWLNMQFGMARPQTFWDFLTAGGFDAAANINSTSGFDPMIWSQLMGSSDIVRQRIGLALLDIWAVGIDGINTSWRPFVMAAYLDVLWDNALGNYRDIIEGVSTSVAMGSFLTYLGNVKANPATGAIPDENYARELMQLFTIGLYELNMDGSQVLSAGAPVATYSQADVSQAARVWTGYSYASADNTTPARMRMPMAIIATRHETEATSLLNGAITIPAGTDGATARKIALDGLFNHKTLPPFVSKQLIQRLVTSNPSAAYINRVANVFVNNGSGVRGDMKSVVRAILTDVEARDDAQVSSTTFGKLRDPVQRLTHWARVFNVTSPTKLWPFGNVSSSANRLGQSPGRTPSVFNWFRPGYTPPGTAIANGGLVAPEFQITNEPSIIAYVNYMQALIISGAGEAKPDYSSLTALASDSQKLLVELNLVLAADQISAATLAQMKAALDTIAVATSAGLNNRIYAAILLVMASPEYLVLR